MVRSQTPDLDSSRRVRRHHGQVVRIHHHHAAPIAAPTDSAQAHLVVVAGQGRRYVVIAPTPGSHTRVHSLFGCRPWAGTKPVDVTASGTGPGPAPCKLESSWTDVGQDSCDTAQFAPAPGTLRLISSHRQSGPVRFGGTGVSTARSDLGVEVE
jgi:hypothetical protein